MRVLTVTKRAVQLLCGAAPHHGQERSQQIRTSCEINLDEPQCVLRERTGSPCSGDGANTKVCMESCRAENAVRHKIICNKIHTHTHILGQTEETGVACMTNISHSTNTWDERETERTGASAFVQGVAGEGSRRRLPVPLLTTRAPWDPQLSWMWQTSCGG